MPRSEPGEPSELISLDEMMSRLERVLAYSPADSAEIAWIEVRRAQVAAGRGGREGPAAPRRDRTLSIRVRQSGRTGLHRTGGMEASELENAVRDALAQARLAPPTPPEPLAGPSPSPSASPSSSDPASPEATVALYDRELAALEPAGARALLDEAAERGEVLRLDWLEGRVAVANSAGLRRGVRVTAASFAASCGRGPGAGSAAGAARRLDSLGLAATLDRARSRHAPGSPPLPAPAAGAPADPILVLSEQSVAALLDLLNRNALSAASLRDGASWLEGRLGETVFAPCINLRDDGTDPRALPFPFDLAGWPKRPVDLIVSGVFATPAVDPRLGRQIGRQPTPHAMASDESIATNLLLLPGTLAPLQESELLRSAGDGIWFGALAGVECSDPRRLRFRGLARGVRQIAGGVLGRPLPNLLWEDSLPATLARCQALGDRPVAIATGDLLFGATAAPLLSLGAGGPSTVLRAAGPSAPGSQG
jgi:PmbA protein